MKFNKIWNNKKKRLLLLLILLITILVIVINNVIIYGIYIVCVIFVLLNLYVYQKIAYNATHLFSTIGRNYRYVVIGDACDMSQVVGHERFIAFLSPIKQSNYATFEFVKRLYSLLDEHEGELIIVKKIQYLDFGKKVSVFDIPYLHDITLHSMKKDNMKILCRFPFCFNFVGSLKVLFNVTGSKKLEEVACPQKEIIEFCKPRNIIVKYYNIK